MSGIEGHKAQMSGGHVYRVRCTCGQFEKVTLNMAWPGVGGELADLFAAHVAEVVRAEERENACEHVRAWGMQDDGTLGSLEALLGRIRSGERPPQPIEVGMHVATTKHDPQHGHVVAIEDDDAWLRMFQGSQAHLTFPLSELRVVD